MSIATPTFFWYLFSCNTFFQPLTFSLYGSLGLNWVSCQQDIYIWVLLCIHSASLCRLVEPCNLFIFKVIINMYDPITILLIVLCLFCRIFSSLVFPTWRHSCSICCEAVLVVLNSHSFWLSLGNLVSPSSLNEILVGLSKLGC